MLCLLTMPNIFALITWNSRFRGRILHLLGSWSWNMVTERKPALGPWPTHLHFLPPAVSCPVKSLLHMCRDAPACPHCMSLLSVSWTPILQIRVGHTGLLSGPGMFFPYKWALGPFGIELHGSGYPKRIIEGGGYAVVWSWGLHIPCRET